MSITYNPSFSHTDWVDNVDRVQAGGDTGFNIRFHGIEGEFASLSTVVKQISDALDTLSAAPPAKTVVTAVTPALVPTTTIAAQQWQHVPGAATAPPGQTTAHGMMGVQLPDGATVSGLRAVGNKGSGNLLVALQRQLFADGSASEVVAISIIAPTANGPFDSNNAPTDASKTKVDNTKYRYYLVVNLDAGNAAATQGVTVDAVVISYSA